LICNFKSAISNLESQISNFKSQIPIWSSAAAIGGGLSGIGSSHFRRLAGFVKRRQPVRITPLSVGNLLTLSKRVQHVKVCAACQVP
jgi:hypothetical protein